MLAETCLVEQKSSTVQQLLADHEDICINPVYLSIVTTAEAENLRVAGLLTNNESASNKASHALRSVCNKASHAVQFVSNHASHAVQFVSNHASHAVQSVSKQASHALHSVQPVKSFSTVILYSHSHSLFVHLCVCHQHQKLHDLAQEMTSVMCT